MSRTYLPVESLFFDYPGTFQLRSGESLQNPRIAYEMYGTLNHSRSNAILLFHALSGSQHAWGFNPSVPGAEPYWTEEQHYGWWQDFIGPGKALDTNKFCIICANYLGGCYGSTGPHSLDPATGQPYGKAFPSINVSDQVEIQRALLLSLGIEKLHALVGPSVGGLIALTFAGRYPEMTSNVISIASGFKTTVLTRLTLFEQILAIENDPHFNGGDFYDSAPPLLGLALARMISHKTFLHLDAIERNARNEIIDSSQHFDWFQVSDKVQSYMLYQGRKFVSRFDANTYLRIIDMWSKFDATEQCDAQSPADLMARFRKHGIGFLVFSIDSDFCFYPEEQAEIVRHLERGNVPSMHITVHSNKGHDSFLLEPLLYTPHIAYAFQRQLPTL